MSVLVDTSVWSLALRRPAHRLSPPERKCVERWMELVREGQVVLAGPIRQEILSGIRDSRIFDVLNQRLSAFDDLPLETVDFVRAAEFFNLCRSQGVTGSAIDLLICAAAYRHHVPIWATDRDFAGYARVLPIELYEAAPGAGAAP